MTILTVWFIRIQKSSIFFRMMQRIMQMTESTLLYLLVVKDQYLEEWNVSMTIFFVLLKIVLQIIILILARSAWSRAKQPVIEISDLSEKESMEYLTKKRKINE